MSQPQHSPIPESEGLQVNSDPEYAAAKAPEVVPGYDQNANYYVPPGYHQPASEGGVRLPFGLGTWAFAALVALCTAIVVGAGVGGGLGAALANKSSDCSGDTVYVTEPSKCPTPDNTTAENDTAPYVPRPPSSVDLLELKCPDKRNDQTRYKTNTGYQFQWWCGVNAPQGSPGKSGPVFDYVPMVTYTIDECMEACGNMNDRDKNMNTGVKCGSIVFGKRLKQQIKDLNANCFLKNDSKASGGNWFTDDDWYAYAELED